MDKKNCIEPTYSADPDWYQLAKDEISTGVMPTVKFYFCVIAYWFLLNFVLACFFHQKVWSIEFLKWSFRLAVRPLELHIQQFKQNASHLQHKNKIDSINSLLQINRQTRVFQPSVTIHNDFRELRTSCLAIEFFCFCHLQECYE